jgi:type IV pilus assembly protein PilY1
VASGYDNIAGTFPSGTGKGNLFILDAKDGSWLKTMTTASGDNASPSGLAHISGYTQDYHNQLVDQVYGADLDGNLWRFDMMDPDDTHWTVGKLAHLVDPSTGLPQPVTTPPEIKIDVANGIDRWVFVGTGKLYDDSDLTTPNPPQIQTMYAFRDGTATTPLPIPATPLDRSTAGVEPLSHLLAQKFGLSAKPAIGWFDDLPLGQRIVVPPRASVGVIAYIATSTLGAGDPCLLDLPAFIYARDYATGQSQLTDDPTGGTGNPVENIAAGDGAVGLQIVTFPSGTGASDFPDIRLAITLPSGEVVYFRPHIAVVPFGHRMSWRLLSQ